MQPGVTPEQSWYNLWIRLLSNSTKCLRSMWDLWP